MCGFTGFFSPSGLDLQDAQSTLCSMRKRLLHRGPDDAGIWIDEVTGIALGHQRLSILDLSAAGHQPMVSQSGRSVIAFNGEIYNHREIRKQIDANGKYVWRGQSDTETLLVAIETWGCERALQATIGTFAFAIWDRQARKLLLARDRMGEKPLYYGWQGKTLLFASELKALTIHPDFQDQINYDVLPIYLRHGYIPAPWSIWKDISKLPPGTWLEFSSNQIQHLPDPKPYWSFFSVMAESLKNPFQGHDQDAINELERHLSNSVSLQQLSDVPLGAFLSGGIDSSTIVALMQNQASQPVRTFSIGFEEENYNEAEFAKIVAQKLGTAHTELCVTAKEAQDVIPNLPILFDEPFGDSSAIPTYLVAKLAREKVTVSLSGDGGDELFGGYSRYYNRRAERLWRVSQMIPELIKPPLKNLLRSNLPQQAEAIIRILKNTKSQKAQRSISAKAAVFVGLMECSEHHEYYKKTTSQWDPQPCRVESQQLNYGLSDEQLISVPGNLAQMMAQDSMTYLPDDILNKMDRASMAVSLECRVPMLDHRVVEFAWSLPESMKRRKGQSKWILRQILKKYVPEKLIDRPKKGFGVPVDEWIRGPLRAWAENLLDPCRMKSQGYLDEK